MQHRYANTTGAALRNAEETAPWDITSKGEAKADLVEAAKRDLVESVTNNQVIRMEAARVLADDLAHARLLRERMTEAAEHMTATSLRDSVLVMRAAAYSTALKNTSDVIRQNMRSERVLDEQAAGQDLLELVVSVIDPGEARMMRDGRLDGDAAPRLGDEDDQDGVVIED